MSVSIAVMNIIDRIENELKELKARLVQVESTLLDEKIKEQEQLTKAYTSRNSKQGGTLKHG